MSAIDIQHESDDAFKQYEESFRENYPVTWWLALFGPCLLTAVILGLIALIYGTKTAGKLVFAAAAAFFLFGRFVILFGSEVPVDQTPEEVRFLHSLSLSSGQFFLTLTYLDIMVALFVTVHVGVLFRLPVVGPKIAHMVADAQFILRMQPWMRRATFLGLVAFVIFPTSTTGSIGGSIFGRLLGMRRLPTLLAIGLGSVLGNGLMFFFSERLRPLKNLLHESTAAKVTGVAIVLFLIVLIERSFARMKKRYLAQAESTDLHGSASPESEPAEPAAHESANNG